MKGETERPHTRGPKPILDEPLRRITTGIPEDVYRILIDRSRAQGVPLAQVARDVLMRSVYAEIERRSNVED